LYFGNTGNTSWLAGAAARTSICLTNTPPGITGLSTIHSHYTDLPIQKSSIDIIVLPHILDQEANPEAILQEIERILSPNGHILILGFNPSSLFCFTKLTRHSLSNMQRYLKNQNFEIIETKTFFFRPPLQNEQWLLKLRFMEILGQVLWPYSGGVYLLVAQKKTIGVTPMPLSWWEKWLHPALI
ncbi:MAG: methyltransferase domain-containing protein, partial [Gammaproteobacteria bacterium]